MHFDELKQIIQNVQKLKELWKLFRMVKNGNKCYKIVKMSTI